jgi:UTP--glucose-1-phosphate uridylyltransferase
VRVRKAVIPAAGLGTRILPATKAIPKELLALVDRPMIQYVVEEAAGAGIEEVVIVTSPGKQALVDHFSPAPSLEAALEAKGKHDLLDAVRATTDIAKITFVTQGQPLGLGHAVGCARDAVGAEPFAVLLPDELFFGPQLVRALIDRYERFGGSLIAVMEMKPDEISSYGVVDPEPVDDDVVRIRRFVEKPSAVDAPSNLGSVGRYVLAPEVFDAIETTKTGAGGEIQLTDAIDAVARSGDGYAYVYRGPRRDAGRPLGYLQATVELGLRNQEVGEEFAEFLTALTGVPVEEPDRNA